MEKGKFRCFLLLVCACTLAGCETYPQGAENNEEKVSCDAGNQDSGENQKMAVQPVGLSQQQDECNQPAGELDERVNGCETEWWECVHNKWILRRVDTRNCDEQETPPEPPACQPSAEICDNADNNCNGRVDENLTRACQAMCGVNGQQICQNGSWMLCEPTDVANEICDGFDNNCDNRIDENLTRPCRNACGNGTEICSEGEWINCSARISVPEECDNINNDCDDRTDEDLRRRRDNECGIGYETCSRGVWGSFDGRIPQPEICDNVDNDCNGRTDDGLTADCYDLYGNLGTQQCNAGTWSICRADVICHPANEDPVQNPPAQDPPVQPPACQPSAEICDNADNNCNGIVDDNLIRDCWNECGNGGVETCTAGAWRQCDAPACNSPQPPQQDPPVQPPACQPSAEICDNADNNCNGRVDENLIRDCWNECGNGGVETCTAGIWQQCDAPACNSPAPEQNPPPQNPPAGGEQPPAENPPQQNPPSPPDVPTQTAPGDSATIEVAIGQGGAVNLTWQASARAVQYEYLIRWGGFNESGSIIEQRATAQTSVNFTREQRFFGNQITWKVRAIDATGQTSNWSPVRSFFFSYPAGSVIRCTSADCPSPNAWYVISRDHYDWGVTGVPQQIIIYYVSANCANGRHATDVSYQNMANYKREVRQNGCP